MIGSQRSEGDPVVVIGAGPAGLTAALEIAEAGIPVVVIEVGSRVGGLAQTVEYNGFRFDIGGHRFFTKVAAVRTRWRSMLGPDFVATRRLSRILFRGKLFAYPLEPLDAMWKLGIGRSVATVASYLRAKIRPVRPEVSFEDWVTNRFGRHLYDTFFRSYTEKVWGIPCHRISARWAAQRIRGLSLRTALMGAVTRRLGRRGAIKTLIEEFEYPRLGPGMMWERFAQRIEALGGTLLLNSTVTAVAVQDQRVIAADITSGGRPIRQPARAVISTMPLPNLIRSLDCAIPEAVRDAAGRLKHRDFLTVAVIVNRADLFPDQWIYVHDAGIRCGRIQNFKNWSPDMVPDPSLTCLGLEYFCTEGDDLWSLADAEMTALARRELTTLGLVPAADVLDAVVVRMRNAYPVYDEGYADAVSTIREFIGGFANLQTIGRGGTHTYNNQDHSMVMGTLAAHNIAGATHDVWSLLADDEYFDGEESGAGLTTGRADVRRVRQSQPSSPSLVPAAPAAVSADR